MVVQSLPARTTKGLELRQGKHNMRNQPHEAMTNTEYTEKPAKLPSAKMWVSRVKLGLNHILTT